MDGFSLQRLSVYCKRDAGTGFRILGVQGQSLGKPPGPSPLLYHQASEAQQSELTGCTDSGVIAENAWILTVHQGPFVTFQDTRLGVRALLCFLSDTSISQYLSAE